MLLGIEYAVFATRPGKGMFQAAGGFGGLPKADDHEQMLAFAM